MHSDRARPPVEHYKLNAKSEVKGIGKIPAYLFSHKNIKMMRYILKEIKPDIIHIHNVISEMSSSVIHVLRKLKSKYGYKIIHTLHDFFLGCPNYYLYNFRTHRVCYKCIGKKVKSPIFFSNCEKRGLAYAIMKGLNSIIYNNIVRYKDAIDIFITPSEVLKRGMVREGIPPEKIKVIPNPVVIEDMTERLRFTNRKGIVYFGRISKEKNIGLLVENFIELIKEGIDEDLFIIGKGEDIKTIEEIGKDYINKRIKILPFMKRDELHKNLKKMKVFVLPSSCVENFPLSVIEAISVGLLPVVTYLGGAREIVDYFGVGYIFDPYKKAQLKDVLKRAINEYEINIPLLKKAVTKYKDFTLRKYIKKVVELYLH